MLEEMSRKAAAEGKALDDIDDFGINQANFSRKAMDSSAAHCAFGSGQTVFEMTQASVSDPDPDPRPPVLDAEEAIDPGSVLLTLTLG